MPAFFALQRAVSFTLSAVLAALSTASALAELPVRQIILYKHGIAFFEREGTVNSGEEARLVFKNTDMNDVLKSLTVNDAGGGRVLGIRYDSNETLADELTKFPFTIGDTEYLSTFLDRLKGSHIELKSGERTVSGAILSARAVEGGPDADKRVMREQITVLLDSGEMANFDLSAISSLRLLDARLQSQLTQYLQTLAQGKTRDKRTVYIDSTAAAARNLHISYITPAAIWKSSYRLSLGDATSTLEGWAIVDNTTDEDWSNVKLSVVSGRPISFISLLDTPRYGNRQIAELPEDRAAGPVVYGGSVDGAPVTDSGQGGGTGGGVYRQRGQAGGVIAGVLGGVSGAPPPPPPAPNAKQFVANQLMSPGAGLTLREQMEPQSSVQGATGSTLGELFEYNFAGPVTVKRNQSAMLPFLQDKIAARKLLIYTEHDGEHPVNAAEITNSTAKTLDGGPITIYDSGAYGGEALVETVKAGDKRLIGYAVDYGTRITTAYESPNQTIREIHAALGLVRIRYAEHQTRTYTIKNVDSKPKRLLVQQEGLTQYEVLSPKPTERTATAYRFEVQVPANGGQTLKVQQERVYENSTAILSSDRDYLLTLIENKNLSETGRKQLGVISDLKRRLAGVDSDLEAAKTQSGELTDDQTRLRQNIDSLNKVAGQEDQVRRYSAQLAGNEAQLAKLRDTRRNLTTSKADLDTQIRNTVNALDF